MSIFDPESDFVKPLGLHQSMPVREWFFKFEVMARVMDWSDEKKCRMLPLYLNDEVLEIWEGIPNVKNNNDFNTVYFQR
jgi:hypothetical protein